MGIKKESLVIEPEKAIDKISAILERIGNVEDLKKQTEIESAKEIEKIKKTKDKKIKDLSEELNLGVNEILAIFKANRLKLEKFLGMKKIVVYSGEINWSDLPPKISLSSKIKKEELINFLQNNSLERFLRWKTTITLVAGKEGMGKVTRFFESLRKKINVTIKPSEIEINRDALLREPQVAQNILGISILANRESLEIRPRNIKKKERVPSYLKRIFKKK